MRPKEAVKKRNLFRFHSQGGRRGRWPPEPGSFRAAGHGSEYTTFPAGSQPLAPYSAHYEATQAIFRVVFHKISEFSLGDCIFPPNLRSADAIEAVWGLGRACRGTCSMFEIIPPNPLQKNHYEQD
jgi:hypothetical protein